MKQGYRLIAKPGTFMNQLQWSPNHWLILFTFLGLATLETLMGARHRFYAQWADWLMATFGVGSDLAFALIISGKLLALVGGAYVVNAIVWFAGNAFGRNTSRRVLFRRLTVVFTVLLTGYLCQNAFAQYPAVFLAGYAFYLWGLVLGYHSIREHFGLNSVEAVAVGLFALLLVTSTWHYSTHFFDGMMRTQVIEMAKKPAPAAASRRAH